MSKLTLSSIEVVGRPGQLLVVDVRVDIHLPGVDLHDPGPGLLGGGGELDLPVQPAGPQQGGVEDVDPVGGGDDLDIVIGGEPIKLVEELQHGPLDLSVSGLLGVKPLGS